ncbi:hypothetical protein DPMN_116316 [Dreissena polymorpha]|uniref:Uncharacterized protein n=1 Tax=Dreissena polymorpha TaxID=45954 RepID=A0A9D4KMV0_DREPO|nr:hypothetical protein DPMN_116316 [Dreissena polymorpha]
MGSSVNISKFVDCDRDLTSTESFTNSDIISDIVNSRTALSDESDDEDQDPAPVPVTVSEALKACDIVRRYLQQLSHYNVQREEPDVNCLSRKNFCRVSVRSRRTLLNFSSLCLDLGMLSEVLG